MGLVLVECLSGVKREEHLRKKLTMLWLEGEGKTVDDATEYLQQLSHTIELLCLINESGGSMIT